MTCVIATRGSRKWKSRTRIPISRIRRAAGQNPHSTVRGSWEWHDGGRRSGLAFGCPTDAKANQVNPTQSEAGFSDYQVEAYPIGMVARRAFVTIVTIRVTVCNGSCNG